MFIDEVWWCGQNKSASAVCVDTHTSTTRRSTQQQPSPNTSHSRFALLSVLTSLWVHSDNSFFSFFLLVYSVSFFLVESFIENPYERLVCVHTNRLHCIVCIITVLFAPYIPVYLSSGNFPFFFITPKRIINKLCTTLSLAYFNYVFIDLKFDPNSID